jgi:hypothetical protein
MPPGENGDGKGAAPTRESILAEFKDELTALYRGNDVPARERKLNQRLFKLRLRNRELEQQAEQAQGAKPKDGQVLLSKEDAAEFEAFKKLNLKAADLVTLVKEHGDQKTRLAERDAEELYVDVADAMGFANLPAFMRFMEREKLHVEFKDVQERDEESGKMVTVKVAMVRAKADEKASLEPLDTYIEREVPDFIEIFQTEPAADDEEVESAAANGSAPHAQQTKRFGAGDPVARKAAGLPAAQRGVTMPATRNTRPASGARAIEKAQEERFKEKAQDPAYASL